MRFLSLFLLLSSSFISKSCYTSERKCADFKTGKFEFEYTIKGKTKKAIFERTKTLEISFFEGKSDTSSVRWINDCEYIVQKIHPKNREERKAVHMKILTTTNTGYTFEFSLVGSNTKQKGTVTKIN